MITLSDMVTSRSISEEGADLLRTIAATGQSFLVYARPRNAGKTTLATAILAEAHPSLPQREFLGTPQEVAILSAESSRGYVVVAEIGHRGKRGYLAGEEVGQLFELVAQGWAVASSLHADTPEEVFDVLGDNAIDLAAASQVRYLIKVNAVGDPFDPSTRRIVESIHEVAPRDGQRPSTFLLYQWETTDTAAPRSQ